MQAQETNKATPDERIAHQAKTWRSIDKAAVADKKDPQKQRAEYHARQQLRQVIDTVGSR
ncbi:MAG TPA: hypothetical protein DCX52_13970 [Massilia sp.]|nr:hypothetical protein [Massilia sp.]